MTDPQPNPAPWEAVHNLYVRFSSHVRAHAWRFLGDRGAAEDVAQEVFEAAFNQCKRDLSVVKDRKLIHDDEDYQLAWLRAVARNKSISRIRGEKRVRPIEDVDVAVAPAQTDPLEHVVNRDMAERLWKVIDEHATPSERVVAALAFSEEMTNREIANILRISIETVRSHKHHVKNKIKEIVPEIMFPEDSGDDEHRTGGGL